MHRKLESRIDFIINTGKRCEFKIRSLFENLFYGPSASERIASKAREAARIRCDTAERRMWFVPLREAQMRFSDWLYEREKANGYCEKHGP
jgi:hypothetical protein